jgi:hypothetical protein
LVLCCAQLSLNDSISNKNIKWWLVFILILNLNVCSWMLNGCTVLSNKWHCIIFKNFKNLYRYLKTIILYPRSTGISLAFF